MSWIINGVPAHPLFVHLVIVLVPLAGIAAIFAAVWPKARRRIGVVMPILATAGALSAWFAVLAGEWLEEHVDSSDLLDKHTDLADKVMPWMVVFVVVAWAHWAWFKLLEAKVSGRVGTITGWVLAITLIAVSIASIYVVYVVGDTGAQAVWTGEFTK